MSPRSKLALQQKNANLDCVEELAAIEKEAHFSPWAKISFIEALQANDTVKKFILDNEVVGYFVAKIVQDQCELLNLTVKKSMQSKGIGTLILLQLKELCMALNIKYIFLEVRRSNATAIKLYEQNGFNETGIRKNYYKTVTGMEDAILMGLSL